VATRRRVASRIIAAVAGAAVLATAENTAAADTIPWDRAAVHAGRRVTVEGVVEDVSCTETACTLRFGADDPEAFTVVLVQPLIDRKSADPLTGYRGRRVQVTGVVRMVAGRPEMILRGRRALHVVAGEPLAETPAPETTPPPAPPKDVPGAAVAARVTPAACEEERRLWQALAPRLDAALEAMTLCVRRRTPPCRSETASLSAILREAEGVGSRLAAACP
jgi:hypothetical protein